MDQTRYLELITCLRFLSIDEGERFIMSVGPACHEGFMGYCLDQLLSEKFLQNLFLTSERIDSSPRSTLLIIDNSFDRTGLETFKNHLIGKLGIKDTDIHISHQEYDSIPRYKIRLTHENMRIRIICYQTNLPIFYPPTFDMYNVGISDEKCHQFYSDLEKFGQKVVDKKGCFLGVNFVRFRYGVRYNLEWYTDRILQGNLCSIFPRTPIYRKHIGDTIHPVRTALLCWFGYNNGGDYKEFTQCLYEPIDKNDRGLDSMIDIHGNLVYTQGRLFFPFTNNFNVDKAIYELSISVFSENLRRDTPISYSFHNLFIESNPDGEKIVSKLITPRSQYENTDTLSGDINIDTR